MIFLSFFLNRKKYIHQFNRGLEEHLKKFKNRLQHFYRLLLYIEKIQKISEIDPLNVDNWNTNLISLLYWYESYLYKMQQLAEWLGITELYILYQISQNKVPTNNTVTRFHYIVLSLCLCEN
jgi:hypothetical protein